MTFRLGYNWLYLIAISEIILLFIPVYIYDKNLYLLLLVGGIVQTLFIIWFKKDINLTKSIGLRAIPILLAVINLLSYQSRKDNFFENSLIKKTEATIIKRYSQGGVRLSKKFYLVYRFSVYPKTFEHVDEVDFWVWFNYKSNDKIFIDYVINNPKISRINKSSLIEYINKDEILKQVNEENKKK
jgi:hypothetical protein